MFEHGASQKYALRRHYLSLRDSADPLERASWSVRICDHVATFCEGRAIQAIAAFWPLGSEVDLQPLMNSNSNCTYYFPRIISTTPPVLVWGTRPLGPGTWGLQEPLEAPFILPPVQLVLVPGLSFATDGHRLGYGKGFYDKVLAGLSSDVMTLGIGFSLQRSQCLPVGSKDVPVKGLVDERGITWTA
jgi:5-formyltetrahydrofolate cyclo-ligase